MVLSREKSKSMHSEACGVFPGGVNSPVRAFLAVGGEPPFISRAQGSYIWDADGNRYIDYVGSWGPAILGHAHPEVVAAIQQVVGNGISFGAPTERETRLAELIREALPSMEMLRLVSSGTEACMSALRLARAYTKRSKILKFSGCYHGHADMLLVKAGSGVLTLGLPDSPGVPRGATEHTLCVQFNHLEGVSQAFAEHGQDIAAIILEPIVGNSGFIRPTTEFIEGLRDIATQHGSLLIFDEVMTGFRVGLRGAQGLFNIKPDLTTLAKVIGGGLPLAAYGGRREIMEMIAPSGPVYQAGTLSGNPVAVAAGSATLKILSHPDLFPKLAERTRVLVSGFRSLSKKYKIPFNADCEGGMFGTFFREEPVRSYEDACAADIERFKKFFTGMLARGIYLAPSAFEAGFVSSAHSEEDIEATLNAADQVFQEIS